MNVLIGSLRERLDARLMDASAVLSSDLGQHDGDGADAWMPGCLESFVHAEEVELR